MAKLSLNSTEGKSVAVEVARAMTRLDELHTEDMRQLCQSHQDAYLAATKAMAADHKKFHDESVAMIAEMRTVLEDLRSKRYAIASEVARSLRELRDLRKFFLEDEYQVEQQRLAGFVELCERIANLQRDGSLNAVADAMLRLCRDDDNDPRLV